MITGSRDQTCSCNLEQVEADFCSFDRRKITSRKQKRNKTKNKHGNREEKARKRKNCIIIHQVLKTPAVLQTIPKTHTRKKKKQQKTKKKKKPTRQCV